MSKAEQWPLRGPAGTIQAVLEGHAAPTFIAVIGHPHPLFGGTMENKVVTTLARAVRDAGGVAVRFNFRGVGDSQGVYSEGVGETEDLLAVISALRKQFPGLSLWLAGFSFGSYVAARAAAALAANGESAAHLMLVAPPVHHYDFEAITDSGCAVTVVQGEEDEVVPAEQVYNWVAHTPLVPDLIRFPGCGHFFHGQLTTLRELAATRFPGALA